MRLRGSDRDTGHGRQHSRPCFGRERDRTERAPHRHGIWRRMGMAFRSSTRVFQDVKKGDTLEVGTASAFGWFVRGPAATRTSGVWTPARPREDMDGSSRLCSEEDDEATRADPRVQHPLAASHPVRPEFLTWTDRASCRYPGSKIRSGFVFPRVALACFWLAASSSDGFGGWTLVPGKRSFRPGRVIRRFGESGRLSNAQE